MTGLSNKSPVDVVCDVQDTLLGNFNISADILNLDLVDILSVQIHSLPRLQSDRQHIVNRSLIVEDVLHRFCQNRLPHLVRKADDGEVCGAASQTERTPVL